MDKHTDKIREIELENTQQRVQLGRTKECKYALEDMGKQVCEEFAVNKKRPRGVAGQRIWAGGALLWANSNLDARNNKVEKVYRTIKDLEKTV